MQNTKRLVSKTSRRMEFDLKGSWYKRHVKVPKDFWTHGKHYKKVLKDQNYLRINKDLNFTILSLDFHTAGDIEHILREDSAFLAKRNIMDYSLLLGVETVNVEVCESGSLVENRNKRLGQMF